MLLFPRYAAMPLTAAATNRLLKDGAPFGGGEGFLEAGAVFFAIFIL